jgi:hypothetical protein
MAQDFEAQNSKYVQIKPSQKTQRASVTKISKNHRRKILIHLC